MKSKKFNIFLTLSFFSFFLFLPTNLLAEIPPVISTLTVYGEVYAYKDILQRVALICNNPLYAGLVATFVAIGMAITFGSLIINSIADPRSSGVNSSEIWGKWFVTILIGAMIYLTFIKNNTDVLIQDDTLAKIETVADVPDIVSFGLGVANKLENGFRSMINSSASLVPYDINPDGLLFDVWGKTFDTDNEIKTKEIFNEISEGEYILANLKTYLDTCVVLEISRSNGRISIEQLKQTSNFQTVLAEASSSFSPIPYLTDDNGKSKKEFLSCEEHWNKINNVLNSTHDSEVQKYLQRKALSMSNNDFGDSTNTDIQNIITKSNKALSYISNNALNMTKMFTNFIITKALAETLLSSDKQDAILTRANFKTGNALAGNLITSNEWLPHLRILMMSAYYGLFPFLLLILSTPMYKQGIKVILWMFLFFTSWSITDAVLHQFAMDKAIRIMQEATTGELSYIDYKLFATNSMKAYASFGNYKNMALMIAGTVTMMIVNIPGGHMLARAVGDLTSRIQNFGAEASNVATDPSLRGRTAKAMADGYGEEMALDRTGGISSQISRAVYSATRKNVETNESMGKNLFNDNAITDGTASAQFGATTNRMKNIASQYINTLRDGDTEKIADAQQNLSDLYKNSNDIEKRALNEQLNHFTYTNTKDGMEHTVSGAFDEKTGNYIPSRDEAIRSENVVKTDKNNFTATEGDVNISKDNKNSKINNQSTFTGNTEKQIDNTSEKTDNTEITRNKLNLDRGSFNIEGFGQAIMRGDTKAVSEFSNAFEKLMKGTTDPAQKSELMLNFATIMANNAQKNFNINSGENFNTTSTQGERNDLTTSASMGGNLVSGGNYRGMRLPTKNGTFTPSGSGSVNMGVNTSVSRSSYSSLDETRNIGQSHDLIRDKYLSVLNDNYNIEKNDFDEKGLINGFKEITRKEIVKNYSTGVGK